MKRTIERSETLPSFKCDWPSMETLIKDIEMEFKEPRFSLSIYLQNEELDFNSVEEVRNALNQLPSSVKQILLRISEGASNEFKVCRLTVYNGPKVIATGPTPAWCAGMTETVKGFTLRHKLWYSSIGSWVFWLIAMLWGMIPSVFNYSLNIKILNSILDSIVWLIVTVLLWVFYFLYSRLFLRFELIIRTEEQWIKRYSTEITTAIALVSLILSILALFLGK